MLALVTGQSCDKSPTDTSTTAPATRPHAGLTVASLVPAATDLLVGMGCADRLVAVSNWDPRRPETDGLPRVGDYRTIDWEKISELHPDVMIVQFRADKLPGIGMTQRAQELGIRLVNVENNRLDDLYRTMEQLGAAIGEPDAARTASDRVRSQLDVVKKRVAGKPPVRTLICRSGTGLDVVGGGNYLDEILQIAGGQNVIPGGENSYPTIDRELLISLDPDVVLH
ncbi:MAG: ABC transporter substrate-binding protein, partial [Tepidisphaeraceae bacterium]